jgi:hypothetical protein
LWFLGEVVAQKAVPSTSGTRQLNKRRHLQSADEQSNVEGRNSKRKRPSPLVIQHQSSKRNKGKNQADRPVEQADAGRVHGARTNTDEIFLVSPTGFLVTTPTSSGELIVFEPDDYLMQPAHEHVSNAVLTPEKLAARPSRRAESQSFSTVAWLNKELGSLEYSTIPAVRPVLDPFVEDELKRLEQAGQQEMRRRRDEIVDLPVGQVMERLYETQSAVAASES